MSPWQPSLAAPSVPAAAVYGRKIPPPMNPKPRDPILEALCILAVGFLFLLFVGFLLFLASRVPIFPLCP